jgi:hypothetical protein
MINQSDIDRVSTAAQSVPPAEGSYIEENFVLNIQETVLDYMMSTTAVIRALEHFNKHRSSEIGSMEDLEQLFARFPEDKEGNLALAQYLWGYNMWTRAEQLRRLTTYFRSIGVVDQPSLKAWAVESSFKRDFQGKVKGLGIAVYHWLVMRLGVDTVKPDVHVRRFAEAAVGRPLSDEDVVEVVTKAAHQLGKKAFELDWAIWEASRGGSLPYPASGPLSPESSG